MQVESNFFPCPNCGEIIAWEDLECRHCGCAVDPAAAAASARLQEQINRACDEASNARNFAGFVWIAFAIQFLYAMMGQVLFFGLMIIAPVMLIRWQLNYGSIRTDDPDYQTAKRNRNIAFILLLPLPFAIIVSVKLAKIFS
jgi:hypothetical protein